MDNENKLKLAEKVAGKIKVISEKYCDYACGFLHIEGSCGLYMILLPIRTGSRNGKSFYPPERCEECRVDFRVS